MKKEDLTQLTIDELQKKIKTTKSQTGGLIGILIILWGVILYGLIALDEKGTFIALIAVAIASTATIPINIKKMKELNNEIEARGSTDVK